ncbi:MAG: nucleotide pyrophosphohydrolase [Bacilli bacterium]|nr:nucleotide pyrophosphohydrolase [Bacilli bacterium]MDD4076666.1 nucleotide pyrophosphohydrolase [Bacilli bacterium]MDD4388282.1 nucleotide pyrophosphohydrolase [Bacilli bacterium]
MNEKVMEKIIEFRNRRNWEQFHTGDNLSKSLVIEASELLELFQWGHEAKDVEKLKEELADVLIYALLIAEKYDLNIDEIILDKIKKNEKKYPVEKAYGSSKKYNEL